MDVVSIMEKHVKGFEEIKVGTPPRKPKEPVSPAEGEPLGSYPKRMVVWSKKVEQWQSKFEQWEVERDQKIRFLQVKLTSDGSLLGGSAHRMFKLTGVENESGTAQFVGGDGENFPPFENVLDRLPYEGQHAVTFDDVLGFKKFIEVAAKATPAAKIEINGNQLTIESVGPEKSEPTFEKCSWQLNSESSEPFIFGIKPGYLLGLFRLLRQLNIETIEMHFVSPVRPIIFKGENLLYIISPIRINK